jgi:alpha-1,3-rhamnosyltransferase
VPPPLVSIAIPAYNHAAYVEACLASVCAQTYPELELVMIDDGSTDGTFEIARKFLEPHGNRFRRIVLERQENQGVCATSNAVIAASRGEWVHLLGSDDVLYPNKVARIQQAIDAWQCPDLALVHADIDMIDSSGKVIEGARLRKQRPPPGISREAWHWLFFNRQYIFNPTVALRKDAILSIGGFDPGLALEDLDCWLRLSVSHAIARVPEVLASYRKHPTNSSRKRTKMLAALLHTYGKFVAGHGTLIPEKDVRSHFRTNLKYVWRRIRKVRPLLLPVVATALLSSFLRTPQVQDYQRFGNLMDGLAKQMGDE